MWTQLTISKVGVQLLKVDAVDFGAAWGVSPAVLEPRFERPYKYNMDATT